MYDLAITPDGDLILSDGVDLMGKSGTDLIEQRISMRLRLHRASWVYDDTDSLGSQLYKLLGKSPPDAAIAAPTYVREALRDMDEISVDEVRISPQTRGILIVVNYHVLDEASVDSEENAQQLEILLGLSAGGSA